MNFIFHEYIKTLYYRRFYEADTKHWKMKIDVQKLLIEITYLLNYNNLILKLKRL